MSLSLIKLKPWVESLTTKARERTRKEHSCPPSLSLFWLCFVQDHALPIFYRFYQLMFLCSFASAATSSKLVFLSTTGNTSRIIAFVAFFCIFLHLHWQNHLFFVWIFSLAWAAPPLNSLKFYFLCICTTVNIHRYILSLFKWRVSLVIIRPSGILGIVEINARAGKGARMAIPMRWHTSADQTNNSISPPEIISALEQLDHLLNC